MLGSIYQPSRCFEPRSLADALRMLRDEGPLVPMAGCTDLYVSLNFGTLKDTRFLNLWPLDALRRHRDARRRPVDRRARDLHRHHSIAARADAPADARRGRARDRRRADPESRHDRRQRRESRRRPATRCRCWRPPTPSSSCGAPPARGACRSRRSTPATARSVSRPDELIVAFEFRQLAAASGSGRSARARLRRSRRSSWRRRPAIRRGSRSAAWRRPSCGCRAPRRRSAAGASIDEAAADRSWRRSRRSTTSARRPSTAAASPPICSPVSGTTSIAAPGGLLQTRLEPSALETVELMLVIRGQRVVLPDGERPASLHIENGTIAAVAGYDDLPAGAELVEAGDLVISPGIVDTHVHVNEPGRTEWEGFDTATRAAAAGGVTTIVDMPLNSMPATTTWPGSRRKGRPRPTLSRRRRLLGRRRSRQRIRARRPDRRRRPRVQVLSGAVRRRRVSGRGRSRPAAGVADPRTARRTSPGPRRIARVHSPARDGDPRLYATYLATRPAERGGRRRAVDDPARVGIARRHAHRPRRCRSGGRGDRARTIGEDSNQRRDLPALSDVRRGRDSGRRHAVQVRAADPRDRPTAKRSGTACGAGVLGLVATDHSPAPPALKVHGRFHERVGRHCLAGTVAAGRVDPGAPAGVRGRRSRAVDESGTGVARGALRPERPDRTRTRR